MSDNKINNNRNYEYNKKYHSTEYVHSVMLVKTRSYRCVKSLIAPRFCRFPFIYLSVNKKKKK